LQDIPKGVTIDTLSGVPKYYTFRIRGIVQGHRVMTLVDGGATHNFIDVALVTRRNIPMEYFEGFNVVVVDGYNMMCTQRIRGLEVTLGNYTLTNELLHCGFRRYPCGARSSVAILLRRYLHEL
jgi:hypothetical protein